MDVPARKGYSSDLTDEQWPIIEPLIPASKHGGRPREIDMREVLNTIFYLNRTGCQWDMLPHDLLPKSTVYDYFARWRADGTWQRILDALRAGVRIAVGREPERENHGGRRGAGLRRRQENHRPQAAHPRRYAGLFNQAGVWRLFRGHPAFRVSPSCPSDGSQNVRLPGMVGVGGIARIMNDDQIPASRWSASRRSA